MMLHNFYAANIKSGFGGPKSVFGVLSGTP